jgi:hypothetical protein
MELKRNKNFFSFFQKVLYFFVTWSLHTKDFQDFKEILEEHRNAISTDLFSLFSSSLLLRERESKGKINYKTYTYSTASLFSSTVESRGRFWDPGNVERNTRTYLLFPCISFLRLSIWTKIKSLLSHRHCPPNAVPPAWKNSLLSFNFICTNSKVSMNYEFSIELTENFSSKKFSIQYVSSHLPRVHSKQREADVFYKRKNQS